ncbi:MAG TPA: aspartate--tRNA ligase [Aliicoccus persicus]|uniref:Aspartate--tRNA(Asp/Asn) ligase n=1 Tax=Aliicoccus persicus TaxID=930138 RepID=A0A921B680_9STAP|nr:aspartate--tRNA ligase [Aliicoccus persicus]
MRAYAATMTKDKVNETVELKGWVQKRRDLGGLIFIDLRDKTGIVQVVFNPEHSKEALDIADKVRSEYVISVSGKVVLREEGQINKNISSGEIEIEATGIKILSKAATPPISPNDKDVSEENRLKYRYLDLRTKKLQEILRLRHKITRAFRSFLDEGDFVDIETPVLSKSTPEGARDYLVPSRIHGGSFYALPQSPQLYKQLLMVSGFEQYYQIVKCFRDEDLRADRQPEFTQVDIEMSFVDQEDVIAMNEKLIQHIMKTVKGVDVTLPIPRMTYEEAMNSYGVDKPDTRFDLKLQDISEFASTVDFKVFKSTVENGGVVKSIVIKGEADNYSRKDIDKLEAFTKTYGAKGLAWMKFKEGALSGPIAKFFNEEEQAELQSTLNIEENDLVVFVADKADVVHASLGNLRVKLGKDLNLTDKDTYNFVWIVDWPLFEYDEEEGRYFAAHHPFTSPQDDDLEKLESAPSEVKAKAYDIVLNGYELGGGSIRIHNNDVQEQMFKALGFTEEEVQAQFGFFTEALKYGTPPHGGIAYGLDRFVMLLAQTDNIRDVIAFPKTSSAMDLMNQSPSAVAETQLEELSLTVNKKEK